MAQNLKTTKFFVPPAWETKEAITKLQSIGSLKSLNVAENRKRKKQKLPDFDVKSEKPKKIGRVEETPNTTETLHKTKSNVIKEKSEKRLVKGKLNALRKKKPDEVSKLVKDASGKKHQPFNAKDLEIKLKENLIGGRFRFINEQLYTMDGVEAEKFFKDDNEAFAAYHDGYRHQVNKWPVNPLDNLIKKIKKMRKDLIIGDFGCGEGKLALSVPNKVISMDLVSCRDDIIACNMSCTPLGSQTLDVAVFCLSLMGVNLNDYILEANRVLKDNGNLFIVEIQSRFDDVKKFVKCIESCGFKFIKNDSNYKLFYFFHFKKDRNVGKVAVLQPLSLKPCLYRKR